MTSAALSRREIEPDNNGWSRPHNVTRRVVINIEKRTHLWLQLRRIRVNRCRHLVSGAAAIEPASEAAHILLGLTELDLLAVVGTRALERHMICASERRCRDIDGRRAIRVDVDLTVEARRE